jgi:hypothetical protein
MPESIFNLYFQPKNIKIGASSEHRSLVHAAQNMKLSLRPLDIFPCLALHHRVLTHLLQVDLDASKAVASLGVEGSHQVEMVLPEASKPHRVYASQCIYADIWSSWAVEHKKQACQEQRRVGSCRSALQDAHARLDDVIKL